MQRVVESCGVVKYGAVEEVEFCLVCCDGPPDAFVPQISHKQLEADEGEHRQSENGQNHDVHHFLHGLDQGGHNGLQTWQNTVD